MMACLSPIIIENLKDFERVPVPCGKCPACKKRRVDSWGFRLMQEDKISESSHFVTLTYDTRTIPITRNGFMTLHKPDFQNFMKRLRRQTGYKNIRYYACGEYGEKNKRPHYHAIIYNCPTVASYTLAWSLTRNGFMERYNSSVEEGKVYLGNTTSKDWLQAEEGRVSFGQIDVGQLSPDSAAYVAKYMDKKAGVGYFDRDDRVKEFSLMSKHLGECYLTDEVKQFHKDNLGDLYLTKAGGHRIAMPKYYRDKIFTDVEKERQLYMIHDAVEEKEAQERDLAAKKGIPWPQWIAQKKKARKYHFEKKNSKNRNL